MTATKTSGTTVATTMNTVPGTENRSLRDSSQWDPEDEDEIKLEDLAPDGGWGWIVALAMIVVFVTTIGPCASFAIIFGDFLEETGQAGTATTVFNSVFMITFSIAGLLTNTLLKRYSMRPVGIFAGFIFAFPNIGLAFVRNVYEMAFIYFLQGIGLGLIVNICNTNFNAYFVKKRTRVMGMTQVVIGLGGIVYPIIIEKMMKAYGFRGTAAMTGALSLNCIVGMTMMHPIEWHARKPEEVRAERAREKEERKFRGMAIANRRSTIDVIHVSSKTKWSSLRSLKEETGKEVPLLIGTLKGPAVRVASISEFEGGTRRLAKSGSIHDPLVRRMSMLSASSLANLMTGISAFRDSRQLQHEKNVEKRMDKGVQVSAKEEKVGAVQEESVDILAELVEMSLLKNKCFLNMCLGTSLVLTSDYIFTTLLPLMLTNSGYTKSDAALAVTVSATAELVSKILLAIFTLLVDVKPKYLFFIATICMGFARFGFLLYEDTPLGALITIALMGMVRSWLLVPQPLVIIEDVEVEKLSSAFGIFAVISGLISIIFGPIVGLIKDWTDSFEICQLALLVMNVLFVIPWAVQFLLVDVPKRRKERRDKITGLTSGSFSAD